MQVDGGVNRETARTAREAGADLLVAGSAIFWSDDPAAAYGELVRLVTEDACPTRGSRSARWTARLRASRRGSPSTGSSRRAGTTSLRTSTSATASRSRSGVRTCRLLRSRVPRSRLPHADCGTESWRIAPRAQFEIGEWEQTWSAAEYRDAVEDVRAAIARGDVYQVNLVQHLHAAFAGHPHALATRLAPLRPLHPEPYFGDGWSVVRRRPSSSSRGAAIGSDDADQGHSASWRSSGAADVGEGRRRARHDRRPRAERPLARVRGAYGPLARAHGDA